MDVITLALSNITQVCYTRNERETSYSVGAVGKPDSIVYAVKGDQSAVVTRVAVTIRCAVNPGDALPERAVCLEPETITADRQEDDNAHCAYVEVAVGERFFRLLTEGGAKGIPTIRVGISALRMGAANLDYKKSWNVAEGFDAKITSVSAYFDNSAILRADSEHARIDPVPELVVANTKHLADIQKLAMWTLVGVIAIAAALWRHF